MLEMTEVDKWNVVDFGHVYIPGGCGLQPAPRSGGQNGYKLLSM